MMQRYIIVIITRKFVKRIKARFEFSIEKSQSLSQPFRGENRRCLVADFAFEEYLEGLDKE